jgi:hypothetical protein
MREKAGSIIGPMVETATDVVLSDGSSVNIKVRVVFKTAAQAESTVRATVVGWFESALFSGLTLSQYVHDNQHATSLTKALTGLSDANSASVVGLTLLKPPVSAFEEKSKQVTAILKSGETVRLTFAPPVGPMNAPNSSAMNGAYLLLSTLSFSDLSNIETLLNKKLRPPKEWQYLVLGLEQINCPCPHG